MKRTSFEVQIHLPDEKVARLREVARLAGVSLQTVLKVAIAKHVVDSRAEMAKASA